jgi:carboxypeptidase Q
VKSQKPKAKSQKLGVWLTLGLGPWALGLIAYAAVQATSPAWLAPYQPIAQRIIDESRSTDFAWRRLAELTDTFGHRLSGSESLEKAIDWAVAAMKADGLENVRKEPVMVPRWVRGRESLSLIQPIRESLPMIGLGGTVATPPAGLEADVLVVRSFDELQQRAADARGKIVLFNVPFTNYGTTVAYRGNGPSRAAGVGAVAVLVRSVGPTGLRTVHTGATAYAPNVPQIPAAAISAEDADRFQRLQDRGVPVRVNLLTEGRFDADVQSYNVIGEIRGRERPEEIVVVGGHLDSWDVGTGAVDDGGGCVVTWDALRLMKKLGLQPRRTVRVVLFTNEENGLRGATAYRDAHRAELANHVLMLESDIGVFDLAGFGFTYDAASARTPGAEAATQTVTAVLSLLKPLGADRLLGPGSGADIQPAAQAGNIPMMALNERAGFDYSQYFLVHHTAADTIARITPKQVSDNAAAVAIVAFVIADLPGRLGGS